MGVPGPGRVAGAAAGRLGQGPGGPGQDPGRPVPVPGAVRRRTAKADGRAGGGLRRRTGADGHPSAGRRTEQAGRSPGKARGVSCKDGRTSPKSGRGQRPPRLRGGVGPDFQQHHLRKPVAEGQDLLPRAVGGGLPLSVCHVPGAQRDTAQAHPGTGPGPVHPHDRPVRRRLPGCGAHCGGTRSGVGGVLLQRLSHSEKYEGRHAGAGNGPL